MRLNPSRGYRAEVCCNWSWEGGDGGGVSISSGQAGPVGHMGRCLLGIGTEHGEELELELDSRDSGGVMVDEGR